MDGRRGANCHERGKMGESLQPRRAKFLSWRCSFGFGKEMNLCRNLSGEKKKILLLRRWENDGTRSSKMPVGKYSCFVYFFLFEFIPWPFLCAKCVTMALFLNHFTKIFQGNLFTWSEASALQASFLLLFLLWSSAGEFIAKVSNTESVILFSQWPKLSTGFKKLSTFLSSSKASFS